MSKREKYMNDKYFVKEKIDVKRKIKWCIYSGGYTFR